MYASICVVHSPANEPPVLDYLVALCPHCQEELAGAAWLVSVLRPSPDSDCGICSYPYLENEAEEDSTPFEQENWDD